MPSLIRKPELQNSFDSAVSKLKESCSVKEKANLDQALIKVNGSVFEKQAIKQLKSNDPYLLIAAKILEIYHSVIQPSPQEKNVDALRRLVFLCNEHIPTQGPKQEGPRIAR
jgi:formate dehydrogenase maturation protein FdhE